MKNKLVYLFLLSTVLLACNSNSGSKEKESYDATKNSLLQKEQNNPASFLTVKGNSKKNIVGQTVVKGSLTNHASVATFKDVALQLSFYSKTKTLLGTNKETIFQILNPGETQDFKTKYFAPKGTDSIGLKVLNAKAVIQQSKLHDSK